MNSDLKDRVKQEIIGINRYLSDIKPDGDGNYIFAEPVFQQIYAAVRRAKTFMLQAELNQDGPIIVNQEGVVIYVNDSTTRFIGYNAGEIIGQNITLLAADDPALYQLIAVAVAEKKQNQQIVFSKRTGKRLMCSVVPIWDEDNVLVNFITQITDLSRLDELQNQLDESNKKLHQIEDDCYKKDATIKMLSESGLEKKLIGNNPDIARIRHDILKVAGLEVPVLITGETGCGKEIVANEIHQNSRRRNAPFIKINCSALPVNLLESELFGYEKGAFTGAQANGKPGILELADGGTLLLDEIGDMPLEIQPKLLRVLQDHEMTKIGGKKVIHLNVRIIAATNRDLSELVSKALFREDLLYRINLYPIKIPPLRERQEDISQLAGYFLDLFNHKYSRNLQISQEAYDAMIQYRWPGNVRELENIMERLTIISDNRDTIGRNEISNLLGIDGGMPGSGRAEYSLKRRMEDIEKAELVKALAQGNSTRRAARILGIDQSSVVRKMKKYNLST